MSKKKDIPIDNFEIGLMKKNPKKNAKSYQIKTVQDIFDAVTTKNINKFIREFKVVLHANLLLQAINKSLIDEGKLPADSTKILMPSFEWIDD